MSDSGGVNVPAGRGSKERTTGDPPYPILTSLSAGSFPACSRQDPSTGDPVSISGHEHLQASHGRS